LGYIQAMFESLTATSEIRLRTSNGFDDDVAFRNNAGDFSIAITSAGSALEVNKATRYVGIGTSPSYKLDVHDSKASGFVLNVKNENATNGNVGILDSAAAAGVGWNFLRMFASSQADQKFYLRGDGNAAADGSWASGGADYAEYFEWEDGNAAGEDRRGVSVALAAGGKIRPAAVGDDVIGIISATPSIVGDSASMQWAGKYLRDDFGSYVNEPCQIVEWEELIKISEAVPAVPDQTCYVRFENKDGTIQQITRVIPGRPEEPERFETKHHSYMADAVPAQVKVPDDATYKDGERRKLNPAYDPDTEYTPREARPEWATVGLMGKLRMRAGQPVGARWIKMRTISQTVEEWLVR
jgi:hypothetical protein